MATTTIAVPDGTGKQEAEQLIREAQENNGRIKDFYHQFRPNGNAGSKHLLACGLALHEGNDLVLIEPKRL